jgi:hypothetical protein
MRNLLGSHVDDHAREFTCPNADGAEVGSKMYPGPDQALTECSLGHERRLEAGDVKLCLRRSAALHALRHLSRVDGFAGFSKTAAASLDLGRIGGGFPRGADTSRRLPPDERRHGHLRLPCLRLMWPPSSRRGQHLLWRNVWVGRFEYESRPHPSW